MDEARGPEDRIEHIVKEAEAGAQFEFNPAAWSAMESELDAAAPVPFSWWKILFPIAGTAILLIILLWPVAGSDINRLENPETQTEAVSDKDAQTPESEEVTGTASEDPDEETTAERDTQATTSDKATARPGNTADKAGKQRIEGRAEIAWTAARDSTAPAKPIAASEGSSKDTFRFQAATEKQSSSEAADALSEVMPMGGVEEAATGQSVEKLAFRWQHGPLVFPEPVLVFEVDSSNYIDDETAYFQKSKWAFSAAVSADLSATGLEGFTDPGTMIGLGVEYYLAESWSLQTGATYAVKRYTALGSEYETPGWISARPDDFLSATALCIVIDIPFNIRKYFYTKNGNTFFASTGVSSYLMLREDYNYEYTEDRPNWSTFWRYENRNKHYLGILNLSVGYEKPLTDKLALGIEPFIKLPLTGIGQGRVRFLSFGANLAIKLRK
jgi:hypothetical protein